MTTLQKYTLVDYVILGEGGFFVEKEYFILDISLVFNPETYNLTQTLQIEFPASILNEKLGIYKDNSGNITQTNNNYNTANLEFDNDSISLSSSDFLDNFDASGIVHYGAFNTLYNNFLRKVNRYFGLGGLTSQLIQQDIDIDDDGFMSLNEFHDTLKSRTLNTNEYQLQGTITLSNLNNILKQAINHNIFTNRTTFHKLYHGFIPGDKLLILDGIQAKIALDLTYNIGINTNIATNNNLCNPLITQPYYSDLSMNPFPNLENIVTTDLLLILV
jgi:hypothetical protein